MENLTNKTIVLGITGGIAAYKSVELVRRLRERGAGVRVVMTEAACRFVGPLTFQAVSGQEVIDNAWQGRGDGMEHIHLGRQADLLLIAPASADFLARLSLGLANDALTTLCLAHEGPLAVAPAMNQAMWRHPTTQEHVQRLRERGVKILGPATGDQACGEQGPGRMLEPAEIIAGLGDLFGEPVLRGLKVMLTAGPTREAIDPVRYLSNHSSGKMGYAIAAAAQRAGARVTLVSGPSALATPAGVERIDVESAADMRDEVLSRLADMDIFIGAAAVADYRVAEPAEQKIKKSDELLQLSLVRNPDILSEVAASEQRPFVVGFAAETENLEQNALDKLERKGLDMIVANEVGGDLGFNSDYNALYVYSDSHSTLLRKASKSQLAVQLINLIAERYYESDTTEDS